MITQLAKLLLVTTIVGGYLMLCKSLYADPVTESDKQVELFELGQGTYRWWGIKVYDARLMVEKSFDGNYFYSRPIALEIQYDIDIDSDDLIETTKEEWDELSISKTDWCRNRDEWVTQLASIWPNLEQGDKLRHEVNRKGESLFFFNNVYLGKISDLNFGPCFLSIWLAPDTSAPRLRKRLLALQKSKRR